MQVDVSISQGQQEARERWGTQEGGAAFDRKKRSFLTGEAREFIAQQMMCVIVGPDQNQRPCGLLVAGQAGFVEIPDEHTCLMPVHRRYEDLSIVQGLRQAYESGLRVRMALCFLQHTTRQRLCVQGEVEIPPIFSTEFLWLRLQVSQAFFHCPKYIRTRVPGLHVPGEKIWLQQDGQVYDRLTAATCAFLDRQVLCYLCTIDRYGQCAVNHRGGAPGYLVTLAPDNLTPGGAILLPDYAGNGAFEAVGNILETGRAALLVPGYADQVALCISGEAAVLEPVQLPDFLRARCRGAQRVIALTVQHVEFQEGDWSEALASERARINLCEETNQGTQNCSCEADLENEPSALPPRRRTFFVFRWLK